jgi:hypothetical protein
MGASSGSASVRSAWNSESAPSLEEAAHRGHERSPRLAGRRASGQADTGARYIYIYIYHRVSVANEVLEVQAVQRLPAAERWDRAALETVRGLLWKNPAPDETAPMQVLPPLGDTAAGSPASVRPEVGPKRVYIRHEDFEKWGHTSIATDTD